METFLIRALQLIMSLSLLVIIHEMGHFLFARLFKTRVEKFCLFFDPWFTLFKFKPKRSETIRRRLATVGRIRQNQRHDRRVDGH